VHTDAAVYLRHGERICHKTKTNDKETELGPCACAYRTAELRLAAGSVLRERIELSHSLYQNGVGNQLRERNT
jgi:hypothetical protein